MRIRMRNEGRREARGRECATQVIGNPAVRVAEVLVEEHLPLRFSGRRRGAGHRLAAAADVSYGPKRKTREIVGRR